MKILTLFLLLQSAIHVTMGQQQVESSQEVVTTNTRVAYSNMTLYESLETLSPTLYNYLHNSSEDTSRLTNLLSQTDYNITFLLPNETALSNSLKSGALNFSQPSDITYNILSFLMLNGSYTTKSFLSKGRQFYTTLQPSIPSTPSISIGPLLVNYEPSKTDIELFSGLSKAQISGTEITCRNGIIQRLDHFLQPAQSPLVTISILEDTEYMEGLVKSLNVSDIISGINKTILAPNTEAWQRANGTSIPYGTLVHTLKYLVLDGVYTTDQIVSSMKAHNNSPVMVQSDYRHAPVNFTLNAQKQLIVNNQAMIIQSDILTTHGIIHLIDDVYHADEASLSKNGSGKEGDNGDENDFTGSSAFPTSSLDKKKSNSDLITTFSSLLSSNCIFVLLLFYLL